MLADLGILYFVGVGDLRVGFAVRNFGPDMKPGGTPPPLRDGYVPADRVPELPAAHRGLLRRGRTPGAWADDVGLLTTADFNHPSDYSESFRVGGELGLRRMLFLRAGYETGRDEGGFAAGFGLQLERKQMLLRVDYAYSDMGAFGTIHHVSLDLSPLFQAKDRPTPREAGR